MALWTQKAGGRDRPVVWDYHVILILKPIFQDGGDNAIEFDSLAHPESIVYDFDTTLSMPCSWGGMPFANVFEPIQVTFYSRLFFLYFP